MLATVPANTSRECATAELWDPRATSKTCYNDRFHSRQRRDTKAPLFTTLQLFLALVSALVSVERGAGAHWESHFTW
jgi:hypothetical protein